jgi:diguanylate cyclase (GGDEF)-like protein/PAS domain S-box-containing protein
MANDVPVNNISDQQGSWREFNLTAAENAWLDDKKLLKLGIDRNFSPYEWINKQGEYSGISADYIHLLEQRLEIPIVPVTNKASWSEVLQAARDGEFDFMSCLVKTKEREQYLLFSQSYVSSSAVIISEQASGYIGTLDKLNNKTVAIPKGHFTNERLRKDYPLINIVDTTTIKEALSLVAQGKVNAFVGDATAASFVMKKEGLLNLSFSGHTDYKSDFSLGIFHKNPLLLSILNKALASISETERNIIFDHWRGLKITQGIALEKIVIGLIVILILFMSFLYWNYRLRQSEEAHKLSEKRFKNLVAATDGIVWEADALTGNFTYISDNCVRILGYSHQDWLSPNFWASHIHPEDREASVTFRQSHSENLTVHELEYRFINDKGQVVWVRDMISSVTENKKTALHRGLMLDITDQKKAELLIKQSEYRFRELIESLPTIAVQGYNEQLEVTYWNKASTALYGYSREEVRGKRLQDLIIPVQVREELLKKHRDWLLQGIAIPSAEIELQHKDGSTVPVYSSHAMLKSDTNGKELFCIDISLAEQKKAYAELSHMAHYDPLTQLPNRRTFNTRLSETMKDTHLNGSKIAVMMIDLDHFKEVNDTLGHAYGDLLLQESAKRLLTCVRKTDTVARLGGDEFLLIIENAIDISTTERIANNILQEISKPFVLDESPSYISASIGIVLYPNDAEDQDELLKNADQAMYVAKKKGRNRFYYFTPEMELLAQKRWRMLNDLRDSIKLNQLEMYYQPIIDLSNGKVIKAEALIRWNHPDGQIPPLDFIPLAEESGLIIDVGNWVFAEVIEQSAQWQLQVCVNASPLQFQDNYFCSNEFFNCIPNTGLGQRSLCIEITEGLLMEQEGGVLEKLLTLRDKGIEVSLDDFGTGYSSLAYLKQFDIDYLKIDKSFVKNLAPNSQDKVLCEAIIVMAHTLGIKVIAEGIETAQQHQLLKDMGCDFAQGYFYDKPQPAAVFQSRWLAQLTLDS